MNVELITNEQPTANLKQLQAETLFFKSELQKAQLKIKALQARISLKEEFFYNTISKLPLIVSRLDKNIRFMDVTPTFTQYTGILHTACIGRSPNEIGLPEDCYSMWITKIRELFNTGLAFSFESEYTATNNITYYYSAQGIPEVDEYGDIQSVLCIMHNITDRKIMEVATRQHHQQFQALVENAPDVIARLDNNLRYIYINPARNKYTNIPYQHFIGKTFFEAGMPDSFCTTWQDKLTELFVTGKDMIFEYCFNSNGNNYYFEAHTVPEFDADGTIKSALCISRDITHLKLMEDTLRQRQQEFEQLVENSPDIITRINTNYQCIYINKAIYKLTGLSPQEFLGKTMDDVHDIDENFLKIAYINFKKVLNTGKDVAFECDYNGAKGKYCFHIRYVPEFAANGTIKSVLCINRDITVYKQMNNELSRLDRLNMVGEMAASIGHEVRNPMTTVRGFLQMMKQKDSDNNNSEFFDIMIDELDRANSIISEFLSLAKNKPLHLKQNNLNSIITALMPLMRADALAKGNNIEAHLSDIPDLLVDEKEIRQLILNLVRNGIEAMPTSGKITIATYVENKKVFLAIKDEGSGIPPEVIKKLGTPFFTTKENGTGLGLAVCYSIVNRHNAAITPKTSKNGTTFYVKFRPVRK